MGDKTRAEACRFTLPPYSLRVFIHLPEERNTFFSVSWQIAK